MTQEQISSVAIVGGGVAGWMTAAALSHALARQVTVTLVDSGNAIAPAGAASWLPSMHQFHALLDIDNADFTRATGATPKPGTTFIDWGTKGSCYLHAYASTAGGAQFDVGRYIAYLRRHSTAHGVRHVTGPVLACERRPGNHHVEALRLASGERVKADLFIDCSGPRAQLIAQELNVGIDDWRHWLPCDRAWEVLCEGGSTQGTRILARPAGWQWSIGLQDGTSHGHVFASDYMSDDEAASKLPAGRAPRLLRYTNGRRKLLWQYNVVAIGASAGCLEPLEGTSLHLVQSTIMCLLAYFPDRAFAAIDIAEFNRQCALEAEQIRDFLILHYHASERVDTRFWEYCQGMLVPDHLIDTMELFKSRGRVARRNEAWFDEHAWRQVMRGQGMQPEAAAPALAVPERYAR